MGSWSTGTDGINYIIKACVCRVDTGFALQIHSHCITQLVSTATAKATDNPVFPLYQEERTEANRSLRF